MDYTDLFSRQASKMKSSKIRELMKYASMPGIISFAGGMPDPDRFPFKDVKSIIAKWDKNKSVSAMQYGATPGYPPLIDILKKRMSEKKNMDLTDQELIVTTGGQQAIFLTGKIFIDPGDVIIIEQPSFIGAVASFLSNGAELSGVPVDNDGIKIDSLDRLIDDIESRGKKVKFFYIIPNFQNPSGVTMSLDKRKKLYELSAERNLVIIEDDPYCDLYFTENNEHYASIKSFGNDAPILYIGSFSKILCPGFRLGWIFGDHAVIDKISLSKQSIDACSSSFGQVVAADYLQLNIIDNYLEVMRKIYKTKKEHMINGIIEFLPDDVKYTDPDGGFFIYLDLPNGIKASELFKKTIEHKVAFVTGEPFHIDPDEGDRHIRLSFSNSSFKEIDKGLRVMGKCLKEMMNEL